MVFEKNPIYELSRRPTVSKSPLLARCQCGKLVWNKAGDNVVIPERNESSNNDQKSTCSMSALTNPDSLMNGFQQKKGVKLCDDCTKDIDSCSVDGSTLWPPSVITLDQERPPRAPPSLKASTLRINTDSFNNEQQLVANLGLSYSQSDSRSDSIATPLACNASSNPGRFDSVVEDKSLKTRLDLFQPTLEGMSDDLLQILTDDSDISGRMMLISEVGIVGSLDFVQSVSKDESMDEVLASRESLWGESSLSMNHSQDSLIAELSKTFDRSRQPPAESKMKIINTTARELPISSICQKATTNIRVPPETNNVVPVAIKSNEKDASLGSLRAAEQSKASSELENIEQRMRKAALILNSGNEGVSSTTTNVAHLSYSADITEDSSPLPPHGKETDSTSSPCSSTNDADEISSSRSSTKNVGSISSQSIAKEAAKGGALGSEKATAAVGPKSPLHEKARRSPSILMNEEEDGHESDDDRDDKVETEVGAVYTGNPARECEHTAKGGSLSKDENKREISSTSSAITKSESPPSLVQAASAEIAELNKWAFGFVCCRP